MKHLQRIGSLCLSLMLLFCIVNVNALADDTTDVNFRFILNDYMSYASCSVYVSEFETADSDIALNRFTFSVSRTEMWERKLQLTPGFYEITYVSILGSWDATVFGSTERFEVKGDKMTVYVGVDNENDPVQMPEQWVVYGEDNQEFHIWDGTPGYRNDEDDTKPDDTEPPTIPGGIELPGDVDTGTEKDPNAPNRPTAPTIPEQPRPITPDEPIKPSAKIGNIVFYLLAGLIMVVCLFLLRKIQKERGA